MIFLMNAACVLLCLQYVLKFNIFQIKRPSHHCATHWRSFDCLTLWSGHKRGHFVFNGRGIDLVFYCCKRQRPPFNLDFYLNRVWHQVLWANFKMVNRAHTTSRTRRSATQLWMWVLNVRTQRRNAFVNPPRHLFSVECLHPWVCPLIISGPMNFLCTRSTS